MAIGTLDSNNMATITFSTNQVNSITLDTENTFVDKDILLTTKVTKAVLNTNSEDTDHKSFDIQIPNGNSTDITFTFQVDANGNVLIT